MYLEKFVLPIEYEQQFVQKRMEENGGAFGYIDNVYPCGIFHQKKLKQVDFEKVTIIYGGNGSGKSTLLNLIATKLELNRIAPFNKGETFDDYVKACEFSMAYDEEGFKQRVPNGSRIITSDDIFDYMLAVRTNNEEIKELKEGAKNSYADLRYGETIRMNSLDDYEAVRNQVWARKKSGSRREFIRKVAGAEVKMNSNGETALEYFRTKLKNDRLYCLDEPENSLSPQLQLELVKLIEEMARYCGCQFIIATHSPFLLAMANAKIYDLDTTPVQIRKWWELENTKTYFEFFIKHKDLFLN